jgi:hypothetical protein
MENTAVRHRLQGRTTYSGDPPLPGREAYILRLPAEEKGIHLATENIAMRYYFPI